ncbi:MAG: hypothetical protein WC705_02665 [Candidatus Paceibacterota bacterium]|jgi:DNA polymerase III delta subunit
MVYFIWGQDAYRRQKCAKEVLNTAQKKYPGLTVKRFYMDEEESALLLMEFLSSQNLFEMGRRACIISEFDQIKDQSIIDKIDLLGESPDVLMIFNESWEKNEPPKKISQLNIFKKSKQFYFGDVDFEKECVFVKGEIKNLGINCQDGAIRLLVKNYNKDTWGLINEVKKLSFLSNEIDVDLVKSGGDYQTNASFFDFSKGFSNHSNLSGKLFLWEKILSTHDEFFSLFNYLSKSASNRETINSLASADIKVKSGLLNPDQAILEIILN